MTTPSTINFAIGMNTNSSDTKDAVEFLDEMKKANCFEYIPDNRPVKMYFDVDIKGDPEDGKELIEEAPRLKAGILDCLKIHFKDLFQLDQIGITECHSPSFVPYDKNGKILPPIAKVSFGIIMNNVIALKRHQKLLVAELNKLAQQVMDREDLLTIYKGGKVFDECPYNNNTQKMRCLYASKPTERRPKRLCHGTPEQTIITAFIPENAIEIAMPEPIKPIKTSKFETPESNPSNDREAFEKGLSLGLLTPYAQSGCYSDWIKVGWAIKNAFDDRNLWHSFCQLIKNPRDYDKSSCDDYWDKMEKKLDGVNFPTLIHMMSETDKKNGTAFMKQVYEKLNQKKIYKHMKVESTDKISYFNNQDVALFFHRAIPNRVITVKGETYYFNGLIWEKCDKTHAKLQICLSNEFVNHINKYRIVWSKIITRSMEKETDPEKRKQKQTELDKMNLACSTTTTRLLDNEKRKPYYKEIIIYSHDDEIQFDANVGKLAFKNGMMDLQTLEFKPIEATDYITKMIEYDYSPSDETKKKYVLDQFKKILNNNEEHLKYFWSVIGYSMIGMPNLEKELWFCVDKTNGLGDNGKTFGFQLLQKLMPCYVKRGDSIMLEDGYSKLHKSLATLHGVRLLYLEELTTKKLNAKLIKEIGDGLKIEYEVMFGTTSYLEILFKMFVLTNHNPKIDGTEGAVYNRYAQISYGSHFERHEKIEDDPDNLQFMADPTLLDKLIADYSNEVFSIIIEYAHKYYSDKLPARPDQFKEDAKESQNANCKFMAWFEDHCEIEDSAKTSLVKLVEYSGIKKEEIQTALARLKYKYNRDLKGIGKNSNGKYYKGGYTGFKIIGLEDQPE